MRKLYVMALSAIMAATAVPAFASVQNVKISGGLTNTFVHRQNFDFNQSNAIDSLRQNVGIMQTTLQVDADLTDNVSATIALINERAWGDNTATSSDIDIYLAYVTLREMLYSPLTLVVGRQDFRYGNSFIIDSTGANNLAPADSGIATIARDLTKQTSLDGIRAILDYNPLTIDIVYALIDQNVVNLNDEDDNVYLFGYNANYELGDEMGTVIEQYFWNRVDKSGQVMSNGSKHDIVKVVGIRSSTNIWEGLNVQGEFAYQGGSRDEGTTNAKRRAFGVQGIANYAIPAMEEYAPTAQYVFTKVTGDVDNGTTGDYTGWDPLLEAQGGGKIYNSIFNLTNSIIHTVALTANPMEDLTTTLSLTALWLERDLNGNAISLLQPDGQANKILGAKDEKDETFLGKEIDLDVVYDYTEDVSIGASVGYYFPGTVFNNANDETAKQVLLNMNVAF